TKWRVRTKDSNRAAIVEDDTFLNRVASGLAIRKSDIGERYDVEAAVRFAVERGLPNRWLVGWSFGTELALMYGASEPVASQIEGAVLLSPPLHRATDVHLKEWAASGKPLTV
ncbi:hypothetical protein, partial [Paraburkholderia sp. SIMBA_027]|uniref:hypothetical protein n=1 Tax=Paraburkholderia sp. SIMBA_027 TaxID=3085770 RepID=UPI0039796B76